MDKEENEKLKKEMKEKIQENTRKFNEDNKKIYGYLLSGINCLYDLAIKNTELNKIALLKDDENKKYGYTHKILKEHIDQKENDVSRFFEDSLENIDEICSNESNKENKVNLFLNSLFTD